MSYRSLHGLTTGDTYASGTQVVGGFTVIGLAPVNADSAVAKLRQAVAAAFPMGTAAVTRDAVGWGPANGVPTGHLFAVVTTNRDGVTGGEINTAWGAVARDLATRLGLVVNLTHAHTVGGATPLPPLTPDAGGDGGTLSFSPRMSPILIGGVVVGGVAVVALGWALLRRPVQRNRGRRRR